jgi:hypothetical protein
MDGDGYVPLVRWDGTQYTAGSEAKMGAFDVWIALARVGYGRKGRPPIGHRRLGPAVADFGCRWVAVAGDVAILRLLLLQQDASSAPGCFPLE